jgi:DNA-3-methyladenine glycosylase II
MFSVLVDLASLKRHFRRRDPVIARVIDRVGPMMLRPQRDRFGMLVRSIIAQQISTAAARSIRQRLIDLIAPQKLRPDVIASLDLAALRTAGLSPQKASYLHDLAQKVTDGTVQLTRLARRTDEEVIAELTQVKGIGVWTAQMFLIFSLGRLDIFPPDDLGIRSAIRNLYDLPELPHRNECNEIAERWRPLATAGTWYCWRSLELEANGAQPRTPMQ